MRKQLLLFREAWAARAYGGTCPRLSPLSTAMVGTCRVLSMRSLIRINARCAMHWAKFRHCFCRLDISMKRRVPQVHGPHFLIIRIMAKLEGSISQIRSRMPRRYRRQS